MEIEAIVINGKLTRCVLRHVTAIIHVMNVLSKKNVITTLKYPTCVCFY